ncbi:MAG: hypothetical protein N3D14_05995 [Aquificaceae bacterium]|nr:hypothetical protein [Aquificaceae bacterium]MCX8164929.1 hypothetical protein [Aquificaceae bacterium]
MENLINLIVFFGKLFVFIVILGVPLFIVIAFIADKVYKKVEHKYEQAREKKIREAEKEEKDKD